MYFLSTLKAERPPALAQISFFRDTRKEPPPGSTSPPLKQIRIFKIQIGGLGLQLTGLKGPAAKGIRSGQDSPLKEKETRIS